ncbi:hypothetical protein ACJRO7_007405 [Eucalyptus globulus]|uniref:C2H2-type domain-containing protein n=1 Tax=Eucalyptus globulus TaxID=34317 RepID=A0ABD3IN45_EUCGL
MKKAQPTISSLNSLEKNSLKKLELPKPNSDHILATRGYGCKFCEAKFSTLQSLGGHQNAHRRERAEKKRARVMNRIVYAFSRVRLRSKPNFSGMRANPILRHPIAREPRTRPLPADVVGPAHGGTPNPKPITITNPQAPASHRPAMANQPKGTVYEPMSNGDPNFCPEVPARSTRSRPPPANSLADGSSFSTHGLEDEELDLTLRL